LALRAPEPGSQLTSRVNHRDARSHQRGSRVDPRGVFLATSTTTSHDVNILLNMSLAARDTRQTLQPAIPQRHLKAEVAHCVGGVLSPILSNIMLDDLDRELWARGHRFVRYADDLLVFVRSERAAQRVFDSVCDVIEWRLRLKVNRDKSSIRHAATATLLGFGFFLHDGQVKIVVAPRRSRG
jgi:hypothetical protein